MRLARSAGGQLEAADMTTNLNGRLIVLFGGGGFIGNYVAQALLERGARLRIASRNPERAHTLRPLANLGQIQFMRCNVLRESDLAMALHGADGAVNLAGAFDGNLDRLMGEAPGNMARIAAEQGASRFVHLSASAADEQGQTDYARAKALGERLVLESFPAATVLRPTVVFGQDDNFINMFARSIRFFKVLPVFGPEARMQLVYVDDVAQAAATALADPATHGGRIYELGAPDTPTMMEINRRIARAQRRERTFLPMPDRLSALFAALPGTPMSTAQWTMLKAGAVLSGRHPGFAELGIAPRPLDLFLDDWMTPYRKHGRFGARTSPDYFR